MGKTKTAIIAAIPFFETALNTHLTKVIAMANEGWTCNDGASLGGTITKVYPTNIQAMVSVLTNQ